MASGCSKAPAPPASQGPLTVVVTLNPLHSLVSYLMKGRGTPLLLLSPQASPHTASLQPSDLIALQQADLVVWVGPKFEIGLTKILENRRGQAVVTLLQRPEFSLLPQGGGGCGCGHEHDSQDHAPSHGAHHHHLGGHAHDHQDHPHHRNADVWDGHLWMDPRMAKQIAQVVAKRLSELDPEGRKIYTQNLKILNARLDKLDTVLEELLAPHQSKHFFIVHDAYRYLVRRYHLASPHILLPNPDLPLTPQRLQALHQAVKKNAGTPLFLDPQMKILSHKLAELIAAWGGEDPVFLDALGADTTPGEEAYFDILTKCGQTLAQNLGRAT